MHGPHLCWGDAEALVHQLKHVLLPGLPFLGASVVEEAVVPGAKVDHDGIALGDGLQLGEHLVPQREVEAPEAAQVYLSSLLQHHLPCDLEGKGQKKE